jgi:hypothetical protein
LAYRSSRFSRRNRRTSSLARLLPHVGRHRPAPGAPSGAATRHQSRVGPIPFRRLPSTLSTHQDDQGLVAPRAVFVSSGICFGMLSIFLPDSKGNGIKPGTFHTA